MRWIIVEGIDGSGKTTVAKWISEHYVDKGDRVIVRTHPSDSWCGKMSRKCLQRSGKIMAILSTLFFICDLLRSLRELKTWRKRTDDVIFVRYVMASAYLPKGRAKIAYDIMSKILPMPERKLLVDAEPSSAMIRIGSRNDTIEMFENIESLRRVRSVELEIAKADWRILDNSAPKKESRRELERILDEWDAKFSD